MNPAVLDADGEGGPVKLDEILYELVSKPPRELDLCLECCLLRFGRGGDGQVSAVSLAHLRNSASSSVRPIMTSRQISVIRGDRGDRGRQRGNDRGRGQLG